MRQPSTSSTAVVGPGAVGTTIAAALHESGRTPLLAGRTALPDLHLSTGERVIAVPGPVQTDPRTITGPADVVFVSVKTTQLDDVAEWLRVLCAPRTIVCVLQNGIEQQHALTALLPGGVVVPAVVWFPAVREAAGRTKLLAPARLTLPDEESATAVKELLHGGLCEVELTDQFRTVAWRKLLQNATAGLMVLAGRRSGMFRRDDIGGLARAYLAEGLAVARADGAVLDESVPQQILSGFRNDAVDRGTSILADRDAGRPLEWDTRNGVIQRRGRMLRVPTPISDVVVPLLAAASDGPG